MGGHADRPMTDCVSLHMWLVRWEYELSIYEHTVPNR